MSGPRRYFPHENRFDLEEPIEEDLEIGPWKCVVFERDDDWQLWHGPFFNFLEVHTSQKGDCIVFRVSEFDQDKVKLGSCTLLDRKKATKLRDRLNELLDALPQE